MKKSEIRVGGIYLAKVSGVIARVRVDAIREGTDRLSSTRYDVTNLRTGRKTTFRSAAKFRGEATPTTISRRQLTREEIRLPMPSAQVDAAKAAFDARVQEAIETAPQEAEEMLRNDDLGKLLTESLQEEVSEESDPTSVDSAAEAAGGPTTDGSATASQSPAPTGASATVEAEQCPDPTTTSSATTPSAPTAPASDLAARIAAARSTRVPGTPVAGMVPNEEQEAILAAVVQDGLRVLVVAAGAGTGKTATLKMIEQVKQGRGQYTAFNTSLCAESKTKFVKCAVNTTHSLAFRAVGKAYQHRLGGERVRSGQVARIIGIKPFTVTLRGMGEPELDAEGKPTGRNLDKSKVLQADFLAGQVLTSIRRFCQSADCEIGAEHLRYIDGIDTADADGKRGRDNNNRVRDYILPFCHKAWADLSRVDGQLPFAHDVYVKLWQLGTGNDRPIIAADYILLDEAQDTAPVFLDVLRQQAHALLVFVGDSNQQIYEWRGAVDAMKAYPDAERRLLTQSYRFGQAVADVANAVLATLEEPTDLRMRGMPGLPSRVDEVAEPRCYLYRTNAGAVGRVMNAIGSGKRPHLIGGGADVVAWCQAAMDLQARRGTRHPELCCFETWGEVETYAATDEGSDLRLMVKLVKEFGAEKIRDALRDMPKEEAADLVVSTAHKSKGREWETVRLGQDFPTANKMSDPDRRLLYVAATRAKLVLDISECPPFCGGYSGRDTGNAEDSGWVPGIPVAYTQPMPTEEDLAEYLAEKFAPRPATTPATLISAPAPSDPAIAPPSPLPAPANGNGGKPDATYSRLRDGSWGVRAISPIKAGDTITVQTKAGVRKTETVGRVLWSGNGVWLATIGSNGGIK